jgi:hypothetical protein
MQIQYSKSNLIDINEDWIMGNCYLAMKCEMILDTSAADFTAMETRYRK